MDKLLDFSGVLNASIAASWLVLAVLALRLVLRRAPKWANVALWGIVALRLLMPFSVESAFSLIPSARTVSDHVLQAEAVAGANPAYLNIVTNPSFGAPVSVELDRSIGSFQWDLLDWNMIWLVGMGMMAFYTAVSYLSLRRKLSTAVCLRENLWQCESVESPFVLGIFRPRIYLPYGMENPHVIAHEKAHIRRKDHWWKPLGFALLSIHWFNPLMWLAYVLLCRDIELACDEKVIAELGNDARADYTQALVVCSANRRFIAACPLAFGEVGVKERVKSIMNYRKPTFWIIVTALALCALVAVCFLTDPVETGTGRKWLDYSEDNSEMSYDRELTIELEEFPGVRFCYLPGEVAAVTSDGRTRLFGGMPIWSVYFCDLNGDGSPEICSESSYGSGIIDERIIVYDYANSRSYLLSGRGEHDYFLRMDDRDGHLYVDKRVYNSDELVSSERLGMDDFAEYLDPQSRHVLTASVLEINGGYFLVKPVEDSWEPDRIEVPMKNMETSPEICVGDVIQIEYDGQIAETYPAKITNVYHICVVEPEPMVPTDTALTGLQAGVLLVPMDGKIYRYELTEHEPQGFNADELIFTFQEDDIGTERLHQVYSLKQYPGLRAVLLDSGRNGMWLCEYSPPERCPDSALSNAIAAGYVVMEQNEAAHGREIWQDFHEKTRQGQMASVTVASYMTLDRDRCSDPYYQVFQQDYPSLSITRIFFDGKVFKVSSEDGMAEKSYEYLMKYEYEHPRESPTAQPRVDYEYILTHDNTVTYDQLWQSIASSQPGAYIDHFTVYTEPKTE